MFPNSETENKAGRREKGEGKGVFCRGGGGSGSNFLALIFNIGMIDVIIFVIRMMILMFPPFVWQKRRAPRESALPCFTGLPGAI